MFHGLFLLARTPRSGVIAAQVGHGLELFFHELIDLCAIRAFFMAFSDRGTI